MNEPSQGRTDRRSERTREALRGALIALLAEKPWEDIAVQDLCERAGIGRSTFYLHHTHKEELLAAGLDSLKAQVRAQAAPALRFGFLDGLVAHVDEQRQIFRSIIGRRSGHTVQRMFRDTIEELVREDLTAAPAQVPEPELRARFIAGGVVEALALWLDRPRDQPAPELVQALLAMCERVAAA
ncbi:MAG: TetR/AcrR family transcriptional regulator [Telluria sp.]